MAASVNKAIIVGHFGRDPEIRYATDGGAIANFSVATSSSWKDRQTGERKETTEWHRITAYNKLAEIVGEYMKSGMQVYVEGRLRTRKWQDKETGADRFSTDIVADVVQMLGKRDREDSTPSEAHRTGGNAYRQQSQSRQPEAPPAQHSAANLAEMDDDIPF